MPKWKHNAKEFKVHVQYRGEHGIQTNLPQPVLRHLGNPDEIVFVIKGEQVYVKAAEEKKGGTKK